MIPYLLFGVSYAFAAGVQPGPLQTWLISRTLIQGWKRTLPAAFAPLISDGPILLAVLLFLKAVPPHFLFILRLAGGLFLLWLSFRAFQTWKTMSPEEEESGISKQNTLLEAVGVNLLNPNPWLGWSLVMGPLFLKGWQEAPGYGAALLAGFYITLVLTLLGIIFLFSFARKLGGRVSRVLVAMSALVLAGFGFYQLTMGVRLLVGG